MHLEVMYPWLSSLLYKDFLKSLRISCVLSETAQNQPMGQKLMSSLHYGFPLDKQWLHRGHWGKIPTYVYSWQPGYSGSKHCGGRVQGSLHNYYECSSSTLFWGFVWYPTSQVCQWSTNYSLYELKASREPREEEKGKATQKAYTIWNQILGEKTALLGCRSRHMIPPPARFAAVLHSQLLPSDKISNVCCTSRFWSQNHWL